MFATSGQSMNEIYSDVCKALTLAPIVTTRGLTTQEVTEAHLVLFNPLNSIVTLTERNLDMRYCLGEICYYLDGRTDLASIYSYSKFWAKVSDDGKTVNSAYGYRLFYAKNKYEFKQLEYVIDVLISDPYSRKAVMPIYNKDDAHDSKDNPCTMFVQLLIRGNSLECHVTMRSNDVWLGLPYDVAFFTLVQQIAYTKLKRTYPDLKLGFYFHNVTSLHAYEKDWAGVSRCSVALRSSMNLDSVPALNCIDIDNWFNNLLTFEKAQRGCVLFNNAGPETPFQAWGKAHLNSVKA